MQGGRVDCRGVRSVTSKKSNLHPGLFPFVFDSDGGGALLRIGLVGRLDWSAFLTNYALDSSGTEGE